MNSYKTRKTAIVCAHPKCVRLTRRFNCLCVRHRNDTKLVERYRLKNVVFQCWREALQPIYEDEIFGDWDLIEVD